MSTLLKVLFVLCLTTVQAQSPSRQFFENSIRTDPRGSEAAWTVRLKGCTAFFVQSNNQKVFVASASHCFKHDIENWCYEGGTVKAYDNKIGLCTRVIAHDPHYDIVLFEISISNFNLYPSLKLSSLAPPLHSRLVMTGFPGDKYRQGKITSTYNCWTLQENISSPFIGTFFDLNDLSSLHNCSTYGGNSGGPIVLEGTNIVVGLPFTYKRDDYHFRDPWNLETAAYLAQMSGFVSRHRQRLMREGIQIVDFLPENLNYQVPFVKNEK